MNEQIDANEVIEILRAENAELRWQLTLIQAKARQDAKRAQEPSGDTEGGE